MRNVYKRITVASLLWSVSFSSFSNGIDALERPGKCLDQSQSNLKTVAELKEAHIQDDKNELDITAAIDWVATLKDAEALYNSDEAKRLATTQDWQMHSNNQTDKDFEVAMTIAMHESLASLRKDEALRYYKALNSGNSYSPTLSYTYASQDAKDIDLYVTQKMLEREGVSKSAVTTLAVLPIVQFHMFFMPLVLREKAYYFSAPVSNGSEGQYIDVTETRKITVPVTEIAQPAPRSEPVASPQPVQYVAPVPQSTPVKTTTQRPVEYVAPVPQSTPVKTTTQRPVEYVAPVPQSTPVKTTQAGARSIALDANNNVPSVNQFNSKEASVANKYIGHRDSYSKSAEKWHKVEKLPSKKSSEVAMPTVMRTQSVKQLANNLSKTLGESKKKDIKYVGYQGTYKKVEKNKYVALPGTKAVYRNTVVTTGGSDRFTPAQHEKAYAVEKQNRLNELKMLRVQEDVPAVSADSKISRAVTVDTVKNNDDVRYEVIVHRIPLYTPSSNNLFQTSSSVSFVYNLDAWKSDGKENDIYSKQFDDTYGNTLRHMFRSRYSPFSTVSQTFSIAG